AKLAVSERGNVVGAVAGGCVEGAVVEAAMGLLGEQRAAPRMLRFGAADELVGVGLPCGGELDVWLEGPWRAAPRRAFASAALAGRPAALLTVVGASARVGASLLVDERGVRIGGLGLDALDAAAAELALDDLAARAPRLRRVAGE